MKARATALLLAVSVLFLAITIADPAGGWVGYVKATLEASMVGGLADWFAVTALFRHPLGLPIPHTAVIQERKDQFGRTLAAFVQHNFLTPDVVSERIASARVVERSASWLCDPEHAQLVARSAGELAVTLADSVDEDEAHHLLGSEMRDALDRMQLAPMLGRALAVATKEHRHDEVVERALVALQRLLEDNRETLRLRFGTESPWWLPNAVEDRIFDRLLDGFVVLLGDMTLDPSHRGRAVIDGWLVRVADDLQSSSELAKHVEAMKHDMLNDESLRRWMASVSGELKSALRTGLADPDSALRGRLAALVVAIGSRLQRDDALRQRTEGMLESGVRFAVERFHDEIGAIVSGTIDRWDATETSDKLELLLGRDLQFIRINGTVVGALAGLVIYAVAEAIS